MRHVSYSSSSGWKLACLECLGQREIEMHDDTLGCLADRFVIRHRPLLGPQTNYTKSNNEMKDAITHHCAGVWKDTTHLCAMAFSCFSFDLAASW